MFCPNCGSQLPDGSAFCSNCGAKIGAPAQQQKPAGVPFNMSNIKAPNMKFDVNAIKSGNKNEIGRLIVVATAALQILILLFYLFGGVKATFMGYSESASFWECFKECDATFLGILGVLFVLGSTALSILALIKPVLPKQINSYVIAGLDILTVIWEFIAKNKLLSSSGMSASELADYGCSIKIGFGGIMVIILAVLVIAGVVYSVITEKK